MKSISKLYDVETSNFLFTVAISHRANGQGFAARYWSASSKHPNQGHIDGSVSAGNLHEALMAALGRIQLLDDDILRVYETQGSAKKIILEGYGPLRPLPKRAK